MIFLKWHQCGLCPVMLAARYTCWRIALSVSVCRHERVVAMVKAWKHKHTHKQKPTPKIINDKRYSKHEMCLMIYSEGQVLLGWTNWGRRLDEKKNNNNKRGEEGRAGGFRALIWAACCAEEDEDWGLTVHTYSYCSGHMLMRVTGLQEGERKTKTRGKKGEEQI